MFRYLLQRGLKPFRNLRNLSIVHTSPAFQQRSSTVQQHTFTILQRASLKSRREKVFAAAGKTRVRGSGKIRLDEACLKLFPDTQKTILQSWIAQGKVLVDEKVVDKAGTQISRTSKIRITAKQNRFVCRAGHKLQAAIDEFDLQISGKRVLDAGISTGGFTDCLLQNGAQEVIGVDVGYGQVAEGVRTNPKVTIMERRNLRYLQRTDLPESKAVQMVTLDLSFISVLKVLETVCNLMTVDAELVVLIKPQFEAERNQIEAGGIVRDPQVHKAIVSKIQKSIAAFGFESCGCIQSPVEGAVSGNKEFLAYFKRLEPVPGITETSSFSSAY